MPVLSASLVVLVGFSVPAEAALVVDLSEESLQPPRERAQRAVFAGQLDRPARMEDTAQSRRRGRHARPAATQLHRAAAPPWTQPGMNDGDSAQAGDLEQDSDRVPSRHVDTDT